MTRPRPPIWAWWIAINRYQQHEIPQISVAAGYGPVLQAFVVYLMVMHHIPAHRCVALLESLTGAAPSVGFVHGMLARAAGCWPRWTSGSLR